MSECKHEDVYWYPSTDESGWKCTCGFKPGEPPGFDPRRDREEIHTKVWCILDELVNANIVYVSNGTGGDCITADVAVRCTADGAFDQYSIAALILEVMTVRHAEYWREVSEGILAGKDPRDRCHCGKLSTHSIGSSEGWKHYCREHEPDWSVS